MWGRFRLTNAVDTDAECAPRPDKSRWGKCALWAGQVLIVLALIDGFMDLSYPLARKIRHIVTPSIEIATDRAAGWDDYLERNVAGLGVIVEPVSGPGLHVDALGIRSTGTPQRNGVRGFLLGSSQAFGHFLSDDATLAAAIERRLPEVNVTVVAGPARTVAESMMNWQHISAKIDAPNFAIFLFSNIEMYKSCEPRQSPQGPPDRKPAVIAALRRIMPGPILYPCSVPEARTAVVERSLYELRGAIAFGRQRNPHFTVVIAPLLYGNESNADKLRGQLDQKYVESLDLSVREFRTRIATENLPGVIDLSAAFDGNGNAYFSDISSHFSRAGAEHLAAEILERLPHDFFGDEL